MSIQELVCQGPAQWVYDSLAIVETAQKGHVDAFLGFYILALGCALGLLIGWITTPMKPR